MSNIENEFKQWLENETKSGKVNSYIRAINILSKILNYDIFKQDNLNILEKLYQKLLKEQKDRNGIFYYEDAPSYGESGYYSAAIKSYVQFLQYKKKIIDGFTKTYSLNQILYGPPGTGKTYNTINKAIEIIENRIVSDDEDRDELKKKFDEYKQNGQIEFITFHQSYGYEEFVEGIKADLDSDEIKYKLEEGVFKRLCKKSEDNYIVSPEKQNIPCI